MSEYRNRQEQKEKREKTRSSVVKAWLDSIIKRCGKGKDAADDFNSQLKLITFELVNAYEERMFTAGTAAKVAAQFNDGFPGIDPLKAALDALQAEGMEAKTSRNISAARLKDPRVRKLDLPDQMWIARWDSRTQQFSVEGDPLFDDPRTLSRSKKGNLASTIRTHSRAAWFIIANPFDEYNLPAPKPRTIELIEAAMGFVTDSKPANLVPDGEYDSFIF